MSVVGSKVAEGLDAARRAAWRSFYEEKERADGWERAAREIVGMVMEYVSRDDAKELENEIRELVEYYYPKVMPAAAAPGQEILGEIRRRLAIGPLEGHAAGAYRCAALVYAKIAHRQRKGLTGQFFRSRDAYDHQYTAGAFTRKVDDTVVELWELVCEREAVDE